MRQRLLALHMKYEVKARRYSRVTITVLTVSNFLQAHITI